jgi:fatty-acyl-CoA synthase
MFHLSEVLGEVASVVGDREAVVFRDRRISFSEFDSRSNRLANGLAQLGFGCHTERAFLQSWESGQDLLALYLYNGNEYLEAMFGAFKSRMAPFNVNYRYVEDELVYLLNNSGAKAIVYHRSNGKRLASIRDKVPGLKIFIEVDDGGNKDIPDAIEYEAFLATSPDTLPKLPRSPDDLYVLYTGGTTGKPKGVLWRQGDIFISVMGGRRRKDGSLVESLSEMSENAQKTSMKMNPAPPFMHAAGQWNALTGLLSGNTVVIQNEVRHLDPHDLLTTLARERAAMVSIVGDAFAQPMIEALQSRQYELSELRFIANSGTHLSVSSKHKLMELIPNVQILDFLGSSEGGNHGQHVHDIDNSAPGTFVLSPGNAVLNEEKDAELLPGHDGTGWWARKQYVPLGYLGDETASRSTFSTIDGIRYSSPGDRARLLENGQVQLLGRDSLVINSGGEKIYVEEVEEALKRHKDVVDALVVGQPSPRWGTEVVAVIEISKGISIDKAEIIAAAAQSIARYKLPKGIVFVSKIRRHENGKPDYQWAAQQVSQQ